MAVAIAPDGRTFVSGGSDGRIRLWDAAQRCEVRSLQGHDDWVRGLSLAPDGRLLSAGDDEFLRLWDTQTGKKISVWGGNTWSFLAVAFAPHGRSAVSGSEDGSLRFWQYEEARTPV